MRYKSPNIIQRWVGNSGRWLSEFLTAVPSDKSIVCIIAIGSAVRGRGHRRSDFDLLVIHQRSRPSIKAPPEVDIRLVPAEGIEERIAKGYEVIGWTLRFGKSIYDPQAFWVRLVKRWADRIPLPSAKEAEARGNAALARAIEMVEIGDDSAAADLVLAALTQFVRKRLIDNGVFPASRPELPTQLRSVTRDGELASLIDDAMYAERSPEELVAELTAIAGV